MRFILHKLSSKESVVVMKRAKYFVLAAMAAIACQVFAGSAASAADKKGPGKVVITYMERVENHTDVSDPNKPPRISGETFIYSMISAYRKLDKDVSGNVYYMHKLSLDDGETVSHIAGIDFGWDMTGKWKGNVGYSNSSNPARNPTAGSLSQSDRFALSVDYKLNPGEKKRKRYAFKTSFNTATDFSEGRTISEKLTIADDMTKKISYTLGYQYVQGLTEIKTAAGICSICQEHYANQWSADFNYKLNKQNKLGLGFLFLKNLYNGAKSDDAISKLSYFHTFK